MEKEFDVSDFFNLTDHSLALYLDRFPIEELFLVRKTSKRIKDITENTGYLKKRLDYYISHINITFTDEIKGVYCNPEKIPVNAILNEKTKIVELNRFYSTEEINEIPYEPAVKFFNKVCKIPNDLESLTYDNAEFMNNEVFIPDGLYVIIAIWYSSSHGWIEFGSGVYTNLDTFISDSKRIIPMLMKRISTEYPYDNTNDEYHDELTVTIYRTFRDFRFDSDSQFLFFDEEGNQTTDVNQFTPHGKEIPIANRIVGEFIYQQQPDGTFMRVEE